MKINCVQIVHRPQCYFFGSEHSQREVSSKKSAKPKPQSDPLCLISNAMVDVKAFF